MCDSQIALHHIRSSADREVHFIVSRMNIVQRTKLAATTVARSEERAGNKKSYSGTRAQHFFVCRLWSVQFRLPLDNARSWTWACIRLLSICFSRSSTEIGVCVRRGEFVLSYGALNKAWMNYSLNATRRRYCECLWNAFGKLKNDTQPLATNYGVSRSGGFDGMKRMYVSGRCSYLLPVKNRRRSSQ